MTDQNPTEPKQVDGSMENEPIDGYQDDLWSDMVMEGIMEKFNQRQAARKRGRQIAKEYKNEKRHSPK